MCLLLLLLLVGDSDGNGGVDGGDVYCGGRDCGGGGGAKTAVYTTWTSTRLFPSSEAHNGFYMTVPILGDPTADRGAGGKLGRRRGRQWGEKEKGRKELFSFPPVSPPPPPLPSFSPRPSSPPSPRSAPGLRWWAVPVATTHWCDASALPRYYSLTIMEVSCALLMVCVVLRLHHQNTSVGKVPKWIRVWRMTDKKKR